MFARILITVTSIVVMNTSASACIVERELTEKTVAMSDLVIIGKPIDYEQIEASRWGGLDSFVTFQIEELVSGHFEPETIKAFIPISTYGAPDTLEEFIRRYGERTKFAVILPETYSQWCKDETRTFKSGKTRSYTSCYHQELSIEITPEEYPDMPSLVRGHCTPLAIWKIE